MKTIDCDYFIIGSGIAGLMTALNLADRGRVLIATKKDRADSNTNYAQGGIACVMTDADSPEAHVADTLRAGAGLCDERVVRQVVAEGPGRIAELEQLGVEFAPREEGPERYDLGKEGGHSHRRVLHAGDITGRQLEQVLLRRVEAASSITICDNWMVIDLVTTRWIETGRKGGRGSVAAEGDGNRCIGAYILERHTGEIAAVRAPYVILASGGGGKIYLYTSNPDIATADGVAMAWRAGLPVRNMEFIQFHPTCLFHPEAKSFLISEAVRGEGARLVDAKGVAFMEKYDARAELSSRDIVARAIDKEMKATGAPCVYLDIRHKPESFLRSRFPTIYETCLKFGIDMARDLIPVVPAAHYFCGGIDAGLDGTTALAGLYACGEVACTGLHGANRLASNSLLEAVVCAHNMAERIKQLEPADVFERPAIPDWERGAAVPSDEAIVVEHNWNEVRTCMWDYVGIVRTNKRLDRAQRRLSMLHDEILEYYWNYLVTPDVLELRNITIVGELIVRSARQRTESRGLHYTLDYPETGGTVEDTVLRA